MSFSPYTGQWTKIRIPTKSTTTYTAGTLLYNDGTDNVVATTTSTKHIGICAEDKTSASNTNPITVLVPRSPECTMRGDIGSGTAAVANIGKTCDIYSGGASAAWGTDTHHQLTIMGYISATEGEFALNSLQQTINAA